MAFRCTYLIERVKKVWNQRGAGTWVGHSLHQAEVAKVTDESVGGGWRESERVAPEVPLKRNDGQRRHTGPDHTQC